MITQRQIREALKDDFKALYVAEFTTSWEIERIKREIELDIMSLRNLMKLLKGR